MSISCIRHVGAWFLVCLVFVPASVRADETVQTLGDAYITQDSSAGAWTIGAGGAALTLTLDSSRDFLVERLLSPTGRNWVARTQSDSFVTLDAALMSFGSRTAGFRYEDVKTSNDGRVLRLDATFQLPSANLRVTRHFVVANDSPTFEVWTTFQGTGAGRVALSNLDALELVVQPGTVHWLTGRQGDDGDDARDTAFMRREQNLAVGQTLSLGAQGRSSEQTVPWLAIDAGGDVLYAALMWSGPWALTATRVSAGVALSWGLPKMTTTVGATPVDGPHAVFGVARGSLPDASAALRSYVMNGIRGGRPLTPLVTYNTWFAYGTNVDEASMRSEMERAAAVGVELFVLDAGWYEGADTSDPGNFDQGLGSWTVDPARFPNGLSALTDYAHSLGMKFGIWVEPERVNLSVVGDGGVDEQWLAKSGGSYLSDHSGQICLAGEAGRQWVFERLTELIDAIQPDYLKWDNNLWVNCDREGHGHGSTDGSFGHVTALYEMLEALVRRYPDLTIENCAGGANRIDLGMLRYTDVAWMDDRTAPSVHVRHNIQGLSAIFPPAYLLSFVTDHDTEPLHDAPDLPLYFRSRMGGALGLCFRSDAFSDQDRANMSREIAIYKDVRTTLSMAAAALLTPQASAAGSPEWDVFQATAPSATSLLVYAYQDDEGAEKVNVRPTNLRPDVIYTVNSVDVGVLGSATGADIMANGIDVIRSPVTAAHILTLTVVP